MYRWLEDMRDNAPVHWALIAGKRTVPKIAEHLIMTPARVEREVEKMIAEGIVQWGQYMGRPILQILNADYKELADFAWKFRMKVLGKEDRIKSKS